MTIGQESRISDEGVSLLMEPSVASSRIASEILDGPLTADLAPSTLALRIKHDLFRRFEKGERPTVAEYLERYPALVDRHERVLSLVYEEFCLLEEFGEQPDPIQFYERYPLWKDSLQSQLSYHRALSQFSQGGNRVPLTYPEPGQQFAGFSLRSVLGQGGAARVFLASEDLAGGREVALKVSANTGREPSILGKLDHLHIVPLHSVVVEQQSGLRGLCMPYRPGTTLDHLIRRIDPAHLPRYASSLLEAISPNPTSSKSITTIVTEERPGWSDFPIRGSFADAVAWIAMTLAKALHHAHKKGIFHRDVKPANVLLTFKDGPQLLDFNLAHDPNAADQAEAALRGGTLPYMAPEQLEAFLDPERWDSVGAAGDLYALGLLMRELLTGTSPPAPGSGVSLPRAIRGLLDLRALPPTPLRKLNPHVRPSLASIVDTCLAFDPEDRYEDAGKLAEDLQNYLSRRRLQYTPNPSKPEILANWSRRHVVSLTLTGLISVATVWTMFVIDRGRRDAHAMGVLSTRRFYDPEANLSRTPEFLAAWKAYWSGNPRTALAAVQKLKTQYPTSAWLRLLEGMVVDDEGRSAEAARHFSNAMQMQNALDAFVAWTDRAPNSAHAWYWLGRLRQRRSEWSEASAALERSVRIDPGFFQAYHAGINVAQSISQKEPFPNDAMLRLANGALDLIQKGKAAPPAHVVTQIQQIRAVVLTKTADQMLQDQERPDFNAAEALANRAELDFKAVEPQLAPPMSDPRSLTLQRYFRCVLAFTQARIALSRGDTRRAEQLSASSLENLPDEVAPGPKMHEATVSFIRRVNGWRAEQGFRPVQIPQKLNKELGEIPR